MKGILDVVMLVSSKIFQCSIYWANYISRSVYLINVLPTDNAIQCVFSRAEVTDKWLRIVRTSMSEIARALPVTWRRAATNYAVGNIHRGEKDIQTSRKLLLILYYRLREF